MRGGKPPSRIRVRPPHVESGLWLKHLPGGVGETGYPLMALQTLLASPSWDSPPHLPPRWRGQVPGGGASFQHRPRFACHLAHTGLLGMCFLVGFLSGAEFSEQGPCLLSSHSSRLHSPRLACGSPGVRLGTWGADVVSTSPTLTLCFLVQVVLCSPLGLSL